MCWFRPLGSDRVHVGGRTNFLVGLMVIVFMGFHVGFLDELITDVEPQRWVELSHDGLVVGGSHVLY